MQYHAPSRCPVCAATMQITRLNCEQCGTELAGKFAPCPFCMLEEKHMQFVLTFLRCRGNIKEVEKALGVSYPTVRNMMEAALSALSLDGKEVDTRNEKEDARDQVLSKLSRREIDVEAAVQALRTLEK